VLFLGLALLLRAAYLLVTPRILDTADAIHYIETAKHFAAGDFLQFNAKIPPLYPLLAALVHVVVSDYEWAFCIVSLIASTLLVIPAYSLSRDLHGTQAARIAALIVSIWPWLIDYASRVGPDALGCTFWLLSVWLFARGVRSGGGWLAAAVLALVGLHLTRAEGTVIIAAAFVGALILCLGTENRSLWRLIPLALGCAILLGAYAIYMRAVTGAATVNYRIQFIIAEFSFTRFAATGVRSFSDVLPVMLGPALLVFMGVGLFHRGGIADARQAVSFPRDPRLELYVLFFAAAQWFISLFVLSPEPRYLMSVIVALSLWSARGVAIVSAEAIVRPWGRTLRWAPMGVVVFLMLLGSAISVGSQFLHRQPAQPLEYKVAGEWMRENLTRGLIFTRKPQVGYYAGMPSSGPDLNDTLAQAIDRAKAVGARYVVVDERYTAKMVPGIAPLLDPALAPPTLRLLKIFDPSPDSRVVVYEITDVQESSQRRGAEER
jgi:4-amino-4-deoxy-L-arabinose transferase-like glycosyltransferase